MKLKLIAEPTFKAAVGIPVAGGEPVPVVFTFKHRTRDAFEKFVSDAIEKKISDPDYVLAIAEGWELDDAFTRENVEVLTQNYPRAGYAISVAYQKELFEAKLGN